ncbi:MAG: hypothetical protein ACYC66_01275 [Chloroflexota bacterium]
MTESSIEIRPYPREASSTRLAADDGHMKAAALSAGELTADAPDGPDYVDDWMEKNLDQSLMEFVRTHCTSFARWDLLRRLHADRLGSIPETLAAAIGSSQAVVLGELQQLIAAGLVSQHRRQGRVTYRVRADTPAGRSLEAAVRAYDDNREFRFALVYSIVRASHHGTVME